MFLSKAISRKITMAIGIKFFNLKEYANNLLKKYEKGEPNDS